MCYSPASITATVLNGCTAVSSRSVPGLAGTSCPGRPAPWKVAALAVGIHARADAASTVVGVLRRDQSFTAQVVDGAWRHVTTASGVTGWVEADQIRCDERLRP
ncbi:SH3 domain-containing protein [Streptomyces sp. NPDC058861]|uniref:SH3 domain-containing protein n=1 Tax=Streptomyces sp. NPDC058861 TaxID=3346653 RepID=UPI003692A871